MKKKLLSAIILLLVVCLLMGFRIGGKRPVQPVSTPQPVEQESQEQGTQDLIAITRDLSVFDKWGFGTPEIDTPIPWATETVEPTAEFPYP